MLKGHLGKTSAYQSPNESSTTVLDASSGEAFLVSERQTTCVRLGWGLGRQDGLEGLLMTFYNIVQNNFKIFLISRHKYILSWQAKVGGGFETQDCFSDASLQCF